MHHREPQDTGSTGLNDDDQAGQLARIRELLFGEAVRSHQDRLATVERLLLAECERVRREASERIAAFRTELEAGLVRLGAIQERDRERLGAACEALAQRLAAEAEEQRARLDATALVLGQRVEAGDEGLRRAMAEGVHALDTRIAAETAELRAALAAADERLRRDLADGLARLDARSDALGAALDARCRELDAGLAALRSDLDEVRRASVARAGLAADLGALARRLAGEMGHTDDGASSAAPQRNGHSAHERS